MEITTISRRRYTQTVLLAILGSMLIVSVLATLGRASYNLTAAITSKPDLAVYLLLPEEKIGQLKLLREEKDERHYYAETKDGPKLVILKRGEKQWYVAEVEELRE